MKHLFLMMVVALISISGCRAEDQGGKTYPLAITRADGVRLDLKVEIADTVESRTIGLMFRQSLADDAGMLFIFDDVAPRAFWMKNTLIPLDMVFLRPDGSIINIAENAIPHDETGVPSAEPARAVLEIKGGQAQKLGLKPNDVIHFNIFNNVLAEPAPIH